MVPRGAGRIERVGRVYHVWRQGPRAFHRVLLRWVARAVGLVVLLVVPRPLGVGFGDLVAQPHHRARLPHVRVDPRPDPAEKRRTVRRTFVDLRAIDRLAVDVGLELAPETLRAPPPT